MHKQFSASFFSRIIRVAMRTTRAGDWVIVGVACVCVVVLLIFALWGNAGLEEPYVQITTAHGTFIYQLGQARVVQLNGPLGLTHVVIDQGRVNVTQSPGRRQICVNAKPIAKRGQWLACLPNRVFLRIYGNTLQDSENAIDGISF